MQACQLACEMEAFLVSTGIVALAEMGDKTQLLALVLAARFRKPWPIAWGILVATLANHALAGALGAWVTTMVGPDVLRWVLGVSFMAMGRIVKFRGPCPGRPSWSLGRPTAEWPPGRLDYVLSPARPLLRRASTGPRS